MSIKVLATVIVAFAVIYGTTSFSFLSWESYLWAGAVEGWASLADLYAAIHPERTRLPEFVGRYHPNHPLSHGIVTLFVAASGWSWPALTVWLAFNKICGLVLLGAVFLVARRLGAPPLGAGMAAALVGVSDVYWLEATMADTHISSVAATAWACYFSLRVVQDESSHRFEWGALALTYALAVGFHLNAAIAIATFSIWVGAARASGRQPLTSAYIALAGAWGTILVIYVAPFATALDWRSLAAIREFYVLNPGYRGLESISDLPARLGVGAQGFARAIVPGYSSGATLMQIAVGLPIVALATAGFLKPSRNSPAGARLPVFTAVAFQLWVTVGIGAAHTVNYWANHVWLIETAAIVFLFRRIAPTFAAAAVATLVLLVGASVYLGDVRPKLAVELDDVVFTKAALPELTDYDSIVVSVSNPGSTMVEAWWLIGHALPKGRVVVTFAQHLGTSEIPELERLELFALVVANTRDRHYRTFVDSPCWEVTPIGSRQEALPSDWFRFATDWGFARRPTHAKAIYVFSVARQAGESCQTVEAP